MTPRFSIVIPTYNRAALLADAVASVLGQTLTDLELIVVDDASTDATPQLMASYTSDARVRYERLGRNGGRAAARNRGAQLAHADLIGFLDSDDRYLPPALAVHWQTLGLQPQIGMSVGGYERIGPAGEALEERQPWDEQGDLNRLSDWLFNCFGTPGSVVLRRSWFDTVGGFDTSTEFAEDWDLFLRLAQAGCRMSWIRHAVYQYRHHSGNSTLDVGRHREDSLRVLEKIFHAGSLPPDVAALENAAKAWVNVRFARHHYAAGQDAQGATALELALALDPRLSGAKKIELLEILLRDWFGSNGGALPALADRLPAALDANSADLRRAASRVAMAQFFRLHRHAGAEARRYLWTGLRLDPRWLLNRGVLSFLLKHALRV